MTYLGKFYGIDWAVMPALLGVALQGYYEGATHCRFNTAIGFAIAKRDYPEAFAAFEKAVTAEVIDEQAKRSMVGNYHLSTESGYLGVSQTAQPSTDGIRNLHITYDRHPHE